MFKESKYPIKQFAFWFLILAVFLGFLKVFFLAKNFIKVPVFNRILNPIKITMELDKKINTDDCLFCFDDYCTQIQADKEKNVYFAYFNQENINFFKKPIKNIYLAYPTNKNYIKDKVRNVYINIGSQDFYLSKDDVARLDNTNVSLQFENQDKKQEIDKIKQQNQRNYILILIKKIFK